jgi:hypothetical protein
VEEFICLCKIKEKNRVSSSPHDEQIVWEKNEAVTEKGRKREKEKTKK